MSSPILSQKQDELRMGDPMNNPQGPASMLANPTALAVAPGIAPQKVLNFLFVGEWKPVISKALFWAFIIILIMGLVWGLTSGFENKLYDPFGTGIRFAQRRDDTGSFPSSLEERQYGSKQMNDQVSQLTSTPEPPNFSEYYGIDASLKNGSVMIERENFENSAISLDELEKANKGF